ncbi:hypothetical protein MMC32_006270 [Xylographa parallela]|nr:hypothetical protein [Xylographa parallela]
MVPTTPAIIFHTHENKLEMMYNTSKDELAAPATFLTHIMLPLIDEHTLIHSPPLDTDYTNYRYEVVMFVIRFRRVLWHTKSNGIYVCPLSDDQMTEIEKMRDMGGTSEKCDNIYLKVCFCAECEKYRVEWRGQPPIWWGR